MDPSKRASLILNTSGLFNSHTSFGSFSNLQDFPFFGESLASLGDLSALHGLQSLHSFPEQLFDEARAAAAAAGSASSTAPSGSNGSFSSMAPLSQAQLAQLQMMASQGSSGSLNLGRNDSFVNLSQNLPLILAEIEQQRLATAQQPPAQNAGASTITQPHHSQQAQPLPTAAHATTNGTSGAIRRVSTTTKATPTSPTQLKPGPQPIAPAPSYTQPAPYPAFPPAAAGFPPQVQTQVAPVWNQHPNVRPQNGAQQAVTARPAGSAPGQEFSTTLYSLASTLPPPMVLSNDSLLGSVGGGLHFQRHCVRRRTPEELSQDTNVFFN